MCPFNLLVSTTGVTRLEILDLLPLSLTEVFVADLRVEVNQVAHFAFKLLLLGFNLLNYRAFLGLVVVSVGLLFAFRVFVFFKVSYTITALGVTSEIKSWRALVCVELTPHVVVLTRFARVCSLRRFLLLLLVH